ncbi:MAG: hypothetical protein RL536_76 [Candidatus Parcubacteria bacterium]|jgi:hypothetical protein
MRTYLLAFAILTAVLIVLILGPEATHISILYYDGILHFLAGIGLGFFLYSLAVSMTSMNLRTRSHLIFGVIICGIIWEIFETYFNISGYPLWTGPYFVDTFKDLLLDTLGAAIVAYFMIKKDAK